MATLIAMRDRVAVGIRVRSWSEPVGMSRAIIHLRFRAHDAVRGVENQTLSCGIIMGQPVDSGLVFVWVNGIIGSNLKEGVCMRKCIVLILLPMILSLGDGTRAL